MTRAKLKSPVSFEVTPEENRTIGAIVDRYFGMCDRARVDRPDRQTTLMDLTACHANGCPLDLDGLLAASDFDVAHDIIGIRDHMDRMTGALDGRFLPRYSLESRR